METLVVSNVPSKKHVLFLTEDKPTEVFHVGDRVRILYKEHKGGIIGIISDISYDSVFVSNEVYKGREVSFDTIDKMRTVPQSENFETVPYYDKEEEEFWRTHWYTPEGIKEKTPEDIKMLEEYRKKWEKEYGGK